MSIVVPNLLQSGNPKWSHRMAHNDFTVTRHRVYEYSCRVIAAKWYCKRSLSVAHNYFTITRNSVYEYSSRSSEANAGG